MSLAVPDGKFFRTEQAAIRHIFALSTAYGMWPGYVAVDGGFMTTCEPDELALLVAAPDDGQADDYADDGEPDDYDGQADDDGPWHDELDEAA